MGANLPPVIAGVLPTDELAPACPYMRGWISATKRFPPPSTVANLSPLQS
jgi:hypothetical protein